jgi:hypothetical protein
VSKSPHVWEREPIDPSRYQVRRAATQWLIIDRYGRVKAGTHMAYQDLFGLSDEEVRNVP